MISKWPSSAAPLCHDPDESEGTLVHATKRKFSISVRAAAAQRITIHIRIYSAWVMLGFGGCWALWETIQLFRREGGVSRQRDPLNRMIMSGTDYGGARGEKSPAKHTHRSARHVLCCGLLVILGLQIKELGLSCFKCCERREKSRLWEFPCHKSAFKWSTCIQTWTIHTNSVLLWAVGSSMNTKTHFGDLTWEISVFGFFVCAFEVTVVELFVYVARLLSIWSNHTHPV